MLARAALPLLAAATLAGSGSAREARAPTYDAAAVGRFEYRGVRLGMPFTDACRHLLSLGYVRDERVRQQDDCATPARPDGEGFGRGPGQPLGPGTDVSSTVVFSLSTETRGGVTGVRELWVPAINSRSIEALRAAFVRDWGPPTKEARTYLGHTRLTWADSERATDEQGRSDFGYCASNPGCAITNGLNCAAILRRYSSPSAEVVVWDGGVSVQLRDFHTVSDSLLRSGRARRAYWEAHPPECLPGVD
jgi:hypothetical protein